ncbi:MAG: competence/damage-inducible protein A [Alphaproteobacteria bacterium]|nr:competence/damage-inducible protein A [Alphaproteobacteria bacterium]
MAQTGEEIQQGLRRRGAAILVIGDEILSGRTQDTNTGYIARWLAQLGIPVREARVVSDEEAEIVAAVRALSGRYDYVFSTGGIGPTHDDITADCMAKAFGTGITYHPTVHAELTARYAAMNIGTFNEARQRMARIPFGAALIANPLSKAPGFQLGNVFVMAGIPAVMQAMLEDVRPRLVAAAPLGSCTVSVYLGEGTIAAGLAALQKQFPDMPLGSYPFAKDGKFGTSLVARGSDPERLALVEDALKAMVRAAGGEPQ